MAPGDPVTKSDLNTLRTEIKGIRELLNNELRHLREDVNANTEWRKAFMKENGPWRNVADSVKILKVFVGVLSPIALWAAIKFIEAAVVFLRGIP
ncbi:MAG: hypothetical protein PVJ86_12190 [Phycisphaerales bacterium]|jgi:hypothetical protein